MTLRKRRNLRLVADTSLWQLLSRNWARRLRICQRSYFQRPRLWSRSRHVPVWCYRFGQSWLDLQQYFVALLYRHWAQRIILNKRPDEYFNFEFQIYFHSSSHPIDIYSFTRGTFSKPNVICERRLSEFVWRPEYKLHSQAFIRLSARATLKC